MTKSSVSAWKSSRETPNFRLLPKLRDMLRTEYRHEDLGKGVRGKYIARLAKGSNIVRLIPEVARAFPAEAAVNDALLSLVKLSQKVSRGQPAKRARSA